MSESQGVSPQGSLQPPGLGAVMYSTKSHPAGEAVPTFLLDWDLCLAGGGEAVGICQSTDLVGPAAYTLCQD